MSFSGKVAISFVAGLALNASALVQDVASDNPYVSIAVRNIFNLNPPLPATAEQPAAPVKITPNGIMTIFGKMQVLFKTSGGGPAGNKEQSYILSEGQRQDEIEILQINEKKGTIKFSNHGIIQDLALANAAPSGGGAVSTTPTASTFPSPNAANNGFAARNAGRFGNNNLGAGGQRGRGGNNSNPATTGGDNSGATDTTNLRNVPTRIYQPEASQMTPEEQVIMIEAQRAAYQQQGDSRAKILPPTLMTPGNSDQ